MELRIDGEEWFIDPALLEADLKVDGHKLVVISAHGEMVMDAAESAKHAIREVWQAKPDGGDQCTVWAGMPFEFCRSFIVRRETQ